MNSTPAISMGYIVGLLSRKIIIIPNKKDCLLTRKQQELLFLQ